jgi:L-aspartate oxidase
MTARSTGADHRAIVVGGGLAGLSAALELGDCTLVTGAAIGTGASAWAQGGIAAALGPDDDPAAHAHDTVAVAGGLGDTEVARTVTAAAMDRIDWLARLGIRFDRDTDGYLLGREAGHGAHRIVHAAGDATGAQVMAGLTRAVAARPDITVLDRTRALDLHHDHGRVTGLTVVRDGRGELLTTDTLVLATGGFGHLFARTTNPTSAIGDGLAMALRAGVRVRDPEFVQFHPTALDVDQDPLPLVTEALRGAGAVLRDGDGHRFMTAIHPDAELAPRDVVARACFAAARRGPVVLDATPIGGDLGSRFPTVTASARRAGLDPHAPLPVTPAQHYTMGGIATDIDGRTSLPGLYACGEVAGTGLHGANRLASNSLLEAMVLGARVAAAIRSDDARTADLTAARRPHRPVTDEPTGDDDAEALAALRRLLWTRAGPERDDGGLRTGLHELASLGPRLRQGPDGRNAALIAEVVLEAALARTESRGAHHRTDHPHADPSRSTPTWIQRTPGTEQPDVRQAIS